MIMILYDNDTLFVEDCQYFLNSEFMYECLLIMGYTNL